MEVRPARWEDVEDILSRLSDQHREEYGNRPGVKQEIAAFGAQAEVNCLWFDGKPQAMLAIRTFSAVGPVTWLACTKEYFEKGLPAIRQARRYMQAAVKRHGPIWSMVGSKHPDAQRWLELIGARLSHEIEDRKVFLFA